MKGCIKYVTRQRVRTESKQQIKGKSKVIKSGTQNMQHILTGEALLSSSRVPEGEILERVEHSLQTRFWLLASTHRNHFSMLCAKQ